MAHGNASDFENGASIGAGLASCFWLVCIVFASMICSCNGVHQGMDAVRREAVINKHATYIADEKGNPIFTWIPATAEKEVTK